MNVQQETGPADGRCIWQNQGHKVLNACNDLSNVTSIVSTVIMQLQLVQKFSQFSFFPRASICIGVIVGYFSLGSHYARRHFVFSFL